MGKFGIRFALLMEMRHRPHGLTAFSASHTLGLVREQSRHFQMESRVQSQADVQGSATSAQRRPSSHLAEDEGSGHIAASSALGNTGGLAHLNASRTTPCRS